MNPTTRHIVGCWTTGLAFGTAASAFAIGWYQWSVVMLGLGLASAWFDFNPGRGGQ